MKNLLLKIFIFLFLLNFSSIYSQYTEVINSNKPGFSESPYSVGTGVYQFENNFFFSNSSIEPTFSRPQSFGFDMLFRTGFLSEKLELNAQISYQRDQIAFKNIFTSSYFTTGLGTATIGAKYLLYQQTYEDKSKEVRSWKRRQAFDNKRLIPSIAIYVGINTDLVNDPYKTGSVTPKLGLLFQQNLSNDFNLISNFFYDKIGTEFFEYSYIITGTYNFNNRWSTFFENQTVFQKYQNNTNIGTGLAFLFSKDLQINASARYLIEGPSTGVYSSFGLSYRIDHHKDSYIELDENGRKLKNTPISRYEKNKKGFFGRLFSVFKKKEGRKKAKRKRN
ncbi:MULTISPECIES: transporter [unclassified Polaribacter]|uniref:transporter n=1 Tax=unclassified Polaribacter TaxID=196858 RepID=UPI0011BDC154|nr:MULTISPECIES: transporter [unclassified Polaribacter]TXD52050.1 transporter [Polaribacter sp. IC063]TXD59772.1 transporter [Polaribacter sp. IC066]